MLIKSSLRVANMKLIKITVFFLLGLLIAACDGKYAKMSDSELREKKRHCDSIPKKSAVFATGCENVVKELKRRREERRKGN